MRQAITHNFTFSFGYTWLKYLYLCGKVRTMLVAQYANILQSSPNFRVQSLIISINLKNKSYIADYMIIASGNSSRHLQALSEILVFELKKLGVDNCRIEGRESNDWKLVDTNDIIIHIFHPEKREFYDLEKMWSEELPKQKAMI